MPIGDQIDPALSAASLALSRRPAGSSHGFASIELRDTGKHQPYLAPLGYALSVLAALITIAALWTL